MDCRQCGSRKGRRAKHREEEFGRSRRRFGRCLAPTVPAEEIGRPRTPAEQHPYETGEDGTITRPQRPEFQLPELAPTSCDGCGVCCEGVGSPVLIYATRCPPGTSNPDRPAGLPDELIAEIDETLGGLSRGEEPQEQCLWFDVERRVCRHYEWRPPICRVFQLGGPACLLARAGMQQHSSK